MKTKVARDSKQQIMWIKGRTDLSPLTYYEWREGKDITKGGRITKGDHIFYAPFTISEEEVPKNLTQVNVYHPTYSTEGHHE